jgi:hypothetical protein
MTVRVNDHAILRYMERILDIDVERLRSIIAESCEHHHGAPCVKVGGARFLIQRGVVVTALADDTVPFFTMLARLSRENRGHENA